jgi:hypothetical protein
MLRSAVSASRRVFDAQWRCAADPRSIVHSAPAWVQLCGASSPDDAARRRENAAPRPEHGTHCFGTFQESPQTLTAFELNTSKAVDHVGTQ